MKKLKPDVLILCGPFVDSENPTIKSGAAKGSFGAFA
jgi:hypothetical protein